MMPSQSLESLKNLAYEFNVSQAIADTAKTDEDVKAREAALLRIKRAEALPIQWAKKNPNRVDLANAFTLFNRLLQDVDNTPAYLGASARETSFENMAGSITAIKELAAKFYSSAIQVQATLQNFQRTVDWYAAPTQEEAQYLAKVTGAPLKPGWSIMVNKTARVRITALGPIPLPRANFTESWLTLASQDQFSFPLDKGIVGTIAMVPTDLVPEAAANRALKVSQLPDLERRELLQRTAASYQAEVLSTGDDMYTSFEKVITRALAMNAVEPTLGTTAA